MTYTTLLSYLNKQQLFKHHQKVLVAVSGGVDSMNLLHFFYTYQKELALEIGLVHVNHGQRPQSDQEELYLKSWAQEKNLPFYSRKFQGRFSEKAARDFRYAFFADLMTTEGYTALVTAHHADDQAETVFMRLLRGSRLRHLAAIKEVQPFAGGQLIRPFLHISKKDLADVFHFEDSSNTSNDFLRNRIRNIYLPTLSQENPKLSSHLCQLSQETALLFEAFSQLTADFPREDTIFFQAQSPSLQYFLVQDYLTQFPDLQLTRGQFDDLLGILRSGKTYHHQLKADYFLKKTEKSFKISKISPKTDRLEGEKMLEYGNIVSFGQYRFSFRDNDGRTDGLLLSSKSPIKLRHRRPGDKISLGNLSKKLRRLFIDGKISQEERDQAIILEQDQTILAVLLTDKTYLRKDFKDDIMIGRLDIDKIEEW